MQRNQTARERERVILLLALRMHMIRVVIGGSCAVMCH